MNRANFTPEMGQIKRQGTFRFWCQKVLPSVYDDSLSYYELLNKVVEKLNSMLADMNTLGENCNALYTAYVELQEYVNNYFNGYDWNKTVDDKLDDMAANGDLDELISGVNLPTNQTIAYTRLWKLNADTDTTVNGTRKSWAAQCVSYAETSANKYIFMGFSADDEYKITAFALNAGNITELSSLPVLTKPDYIATKYNEDTGNVIVLFGKSASDEEYPVNWCVWNNDVFTNTLGEIETGMTLYSLFSNENNIYGYCKIGNTLKIINAYVNESNSTVELSFTDKCTLDGLKNAARIFQGFGTDGNYFYYAMSNPNVIGVYTLSGKFKRYVNVGEFADNNVFIGEIEQLVKIDGKLYLLSQFYYDREQKTRFAALLLIDFKKSLPNGYPHTSYEVIQKEIFVSPQSGWGYQDGTSEYPFANINIAYFCSCTPNNNSVNIIYKAQSELTEIRVKNLIFQTNKSININCTAENVKLIFEKIKCAAGTLALDGCTLVSCNTLKRSTLIGTSITFEPNPENETHYELKGIFQLSGVYKCSTDIENCFNFDSASIGAINITSYTNKVPQTNANNTANVITKGCFNTGKYVNKNIVYTGNGLAVGSNTLILGNREVIFTVSVDTDTPQSVICVSPDTSNLVQNVSSWCVNVCGTDGSSYFSSSYKFIYAGNNRWTLSEIDKVVITSLGTSFSVVNETGEYDSANPLVKIDYILK